MRISINKADPGYRYDIDLNRVRVYVDGELCREAVTADEGQGIVMRHRRDEAGRLVTENGHWVLETLKANVRIEVLGDDGESIRAPKVKVERGLDGRIAVLAYSRMHPRNIRRITFDRTVTDGFSAEQLRQACGVAAGAAAEHLCVHHGDIFDPSEAARVGVDAADQLLASESSNTVH